MVIRFIVRMRTSRPADATTGYPLLDRIAPSVNKLVIHVERNSDFRQPKVATRGPLAVDRGLIRSVDDRVADYIHDGGYDSPHNARITWKNHLQQESEWEGEMWGKNANFLGLEEFGGGRMKPRRKMPRRRRGEPTPCTPRPALRA